MLAYLVGGYLRDALLGRSTRDVDIAVQGDALSLGREIARHTGGTYVDLAPAHGVARIIWNRQGESRWVLDIASIALDIDQDLRRRDFTADAMALPLEVWDSDGWEDRILDPLGGLDDLRKKRIRATGPSVFQDDPARLLRAVRLASSLGFRIHPDTSSLIARQSHLVTTLPGERVRDELLAIISLNDAKAHLNLLDNLGLLCGIIP